MDDHVVLDTPSIDRIRRDYYRGVNPAITNRQTFAFRGQNREYRLRTGYPRSQGAFRFADSPGYEPSLIPHAFRSSLEPYLWPSGLVYLIPTLLAVPNRLPLWEMVNTSAAMTVELAQHYGLRTNGLDVTFDIDVAVWFATNTYLSSERRFVPYQWKNIRAVCEWPAVYVFALDRRQADYGPVDRRDYSILECCPERVLAQKCSVFSASHLYPNTIADDLLFRCFLHPDFSDRPSLTFQDLFPPPEVDTLYARLLEWKSARRSPAFSEIVEYRYS